jgi:hypothetical protein
VISSALNPADAAIHFIFFGSDQDLAPLLPLRGWYALERLMRRFGSRVLDVLGNSMCVVLSSTDVR